MSTHFEVVGVSSPGKELAEVENDENIKVIPLLMSRKMTPFQDMKSLWKTYWLLKNEQPQIVHTHTPKAGVIGMLAAKLARVPIRLHTVAGLPLMETNGVKRRVLDVIEKITYASATKIYPNSKSLHDFIVKHKYACISKLKVIGVGSSNGINTSFFSREQISEAQGTALKDELGIKPQDFVFIFVGRLVQHKGINELINAFSKLSSKQVKLLLVGPFEDDLDPLFPDVMDEIKHNSNIIMTGFQPDVRPYFAVSDALVFPSYREGFPNVVMQAGAMGLPSIVSDINGCNEIIIHGKNGVIIPVKDANAIEQAMEDFVNDKPLLSKLKDNARRLIEERYEQSMVWKALLDEYNSLLMEVDNGL